MEDITLYTTIYIISRKYDISDDTARYIIKDLTGYMPPPHFKLEAFFSDRGHRPRTRYIIEEMRRQGLSITEMSPLLRLKQPTVSYHLANLKEEKEAGKTYKYKNYYLKELQNDVLERIRLNP